MALPSCCWSEGGQVTDLPAGVTQETRNYMLVTATLDHLNHTAALSEMLPLGIKENKQAEAAPAAAVAPSGDCPAHPSAVALPDGCGKSLMGAQGSVNKIIPVDLDGSIAFAGGLESSPFLSSSQSTQQ